MIPLLLLVVGALTIDTPAPPGAPPAAEAPSDVAVDAAQLQVREQLDTAEAAFMERARLMNQLMSRCPEHEEALRGIYAMGKSGFILG
jgi:hypothetical protein